MAHPGSTPPAEPAGPYDPEPGKETAPTDGPASTPASPEAREPATQPALFGPAQRGGVEAPPPRTPSLLRRSPFVLGFLLAAGALVAVLLGDAVAALSSVWILIVVSMFLALGLNPLVELLARHRVRRGRAVAIVFVLALALLTAFVLAIVPPLVEQVTALVDDLPEVVDQLQRNELVQRLDEQFGIVEQLQQLANAQLAGQAFGGLLGLGRALIGGIFSALTVIVLTLYFLSALPSITGSTYRLVPASRRPRIRLLGDRVVANVGGFVAGQSAVAVTAAVSTYLFLMILANVVDAPLIGRYALALALVVGLLDLIPLIGATLGAVVVVLVGLADSVTVAIIIAAFFVLYQQVENYMIAPRIMSRSVNVAPMVTIVSALIGGTLLGVVGALVAIPVGASVVMLVREVVVPHQDAR